MRKQKLIDIEPRFLSVADVCRIYRLGRSSIYLLIKDGSIETAKVRGRRLIKVESLESLLAQGDVA